MRRRTTNSCCQHVDAEAAADTEAADTVAAGVMVVEIVVDEGEVVTVTFAAPLDELPTAPARGGAAAPAPFSTEEGGADTAVVVIDSGAAISTLLGGTAGKTPH